ncbi:Endonuclease/exonuclease/phosphatase [Infundibulicybe gibba]|nr:Endonuclease/exonuclease/phosphatase [Infundibulicybe gibba]
MRISTYNLRFDSMPNNITVQQSIAALPDPLVQPVFEGITKEQPWSTRRVRVAAHLLSEGVVIADFQEALVRQVHDLAELFGSDWAWIGVGRDDGVEAGEFSPIFYKKSELTLISNDSFWLSNTPFEPSKFPGAGSVRICTAAHFEVTATQKRFTLLNTHLDDQSDAQRRLGASLLLQRAHFEAATTNAPVIMTGDFNSESIGVDAGAYNISTGALPPVPINATFAARFPVTSTQLPGFKMLDLRGKTPRQSVAGDFATFTGFKLPNDTSSWTRIDFVFGGSNLGWTAEGYKVGTSMSDDGVLDSDHRPVFADFEL